MAGAEAAASGLRAAVRCDELRRERERESLGGGDLMRGEAGQWGVESPELGPEVVGLRGRGALGAAESEEAAEGC